MRAAALVLVAGLLTGCQPGLTDGDAEWTEVVGVHCEERGGSADCVTIKSWECLMMVEETLEGIMGEGSMDATPPMFYPEAIMSACRKVAEVAADTGNPSVNLPLNTPEPQL